MTTHDSHRARFGPFEVDLHTRELWKFGTRLKLVGQPFEILAVLLSRPGELVTREELRQRLWPSDTFVDFNHGLNAAVNKLRAALGDLAEAPRYVETLPRRGYRFVAAIEWVNAKPTDAKSGWWPRSLRPFRPSKFLCKLQTHLHRPSSLKPIGELLARSHGSPI
jgi:DNA-binding winged helix-turn-helix (wHTH) protein